MTEKKGYFNDIDVDALKAGENISIDLQGLWAFVAMTQAVRGSFRKMENPRSYRQIEEEAEEERKNALQGMENGLKNLKKAHHDMVSSLPELENDLKHVETLVLVCKNMKGMIATETFYSLSVIISDIIIDLIKRFEKVTVSIDKMTKDEDAGIQSENNEQS